MGWPLGQPHQHPDLDLLHQRPGPRYRGPCPGCPWHLLDLRHGPGFLLRKRRSPSKFEELVGTIPTHFAIGKVAGGVVPFAKFTLCYLRRSSRGSCIASSGAGGRPERLGRRNLGVALLGFGDMAPPWHCWWCRMGGIWQAKPRMCPLNLCRGSWRSSK